MFGWASDFRKHLRQEKSAEKRHIALRALLLVVSLLVYLPRIASYPLIPWDEAIYANIARLMLRQGYWLIPHMDMVVPGEISVFFEKPPLMFWLQAVSMKVLGVTVFAARVPTIIAVSLLSQLVYSMGTRLYNWQTGLAGGFILLVLPSLYKYGHSGTSAALDVPLVLFGSLFVWFVVQAKHDSSKLIIAGIAAGLAVLTKGPAAFVFIVVLAPFILFNWNHYLTRQTVISTGVTVFITLPWPIYAWLKHGNRFISDFLLRQVRRSQGEFQTYGDPLLPFMNFPYFKSLFTNNIYAPFIVSALIFVFYQLLVQSDWDDMKRELGLAWWLISVPAAFAVAGGNHLWYVLPLIVPLAVLLGALVSESIRFINSQGSRIFGREIVNDKFYVLLGILCVITATTVYPIIEEPPAREWSSQKELGLSINDTPKDSTIYIQQGIFDTRYNHYTFEFYADRSLKTTSIRRIRGDKSIVYAIISKSSESNINRPYKVLYHRSSSDIVAIKFIK